MLPLTSFLTLAAEDHANKMLRATLLFAAVLAVSALSPLEAYGHAESALLEKVDITGDGGIVKYIIARGSGSKATKGAQISVRGTEGSRLPRRSAFGPPWLHWLPLTFCSAPLAPLTSRSAPISHCTPT